MEGTKDKRIVADRIAVGETLEQIFPEWAQRFNTSKVEVPTAEKDNSNKTISITSLSPTNAKTLLVSLGLVANKKQAQHIIEQGGLKIKVPGANFIPFRQYNQNIEPCVGMVLRVGYRTVEVVE